MPPARRYSAAVEPATAAPPAVPSAAHSSEALVARLAALASRTDGRLGELLPPADRTPAPLHEAIRYAALGPGKRLRPALVLLAGEACGGSGAAPPDGAILDAACAVEMVHAFSLVHDDLPALDDDDLRRGRPTCHRAFGEAVAILAGDALFSLAFATIGGLDAPSARVVAVLRELTAATGPEGLVGGETIDVLSEGVAVSAETLAEIHAKKTGSLIAASCGIGALLAGASGTETEALREYGRGVGLAFQIADDVLNETSTPEALGKAAASDRERGKATYPALFGVATSREKALALADGAVASLGALSRSEAREALGALARYAVERLR